MKRSVFFLCCGLIIAPMAYAKLSATGFPDTISDVSFKSRVENKADGYKPFLDKKAYQELKIVPGEEIYTDHMIATMESLSEQQKHDAQTMNIYEYCAKYPYDSEKCSHITQISKPFYTGAYTGYTIGGGPVVENNTVVGGSCYPAAKDNNYTNKILTTGKYENIHPAFEKGLITVFRKEGGCGTIKNDPCGYTCYGIGSGSKCAGVLVKSRAEAEDIYYNRYFVNYKIDKLPDVISADIFIASMGSGPGTAMSQFREFLGLPANSQPVDDAMIMAVQNYPGDIHNDWMDKRNIFLQEIARKRYGDSSVGRAYTNSIIIQRKNGCHVRPTEPIYR